MKRLLKRIVLALFAAVAVVLPLMGDTVSSGAFSQAVSFDHESWWRGRCPICGGLPEFAYFKDNGACWLTCHECGNEWLFQRVTCPYCGNQDQSLLGYFFTNDKELSFCRFYVCDKCHKYLKVVDLRVGGEVLTGLQDALIQKMERQVGAMGYEPGWAK